MSNKEKNNLTVIINAVLTAISTIIGALFLDSCIGII